MAKRNKKHINEAELQAAWRRLPAGSDLEIADGRKATVVFPGVWNLDAGPDFLDAEIALDGKNIAGDVEIHVKTSDWIRHGHNGDPKYDNVVLHAVADDDLADNPQESLAGKLPDAPLAIIQPAKSRANLADSDKFPLGTCGDLFSSMDDSQLRSLLLAAGRKRFNLKSGRTAASMLEHGVDSTLTLLIFDACGYQNNREPFKELFHRFHSHATTSREDAEAALWGESGLVPDPVAVEMEPEMKSFASTIWNRWWKIRTRSTSPIEWRRSGTRPLNSPERRLAALSALLAKMNAGPFAFLAEIAERSESPKQLLDNVVAAFEVHHPLWDNWTTFTAKSRKPAAVMGASRALEITINVALPALEACASFKSKTTPARAPLPKHIGDMAREAFEMAPASQKNRITKMAALKWLVPPSRLGKVITNANALQGAIHIYKTFCGAATQNCAHCQLPALFARPATRGQQSQN